MDKIKVTSSNHSNVFSSILFAIIIPIVSYYAHPIIGLPGLIVMWIFWLLFVTATIVHFVSLRTYYIFDSTGLELSDGSLKVKIDISDITAINTQFTIAKRMGLYEGHPYLVLSLNQSGLSKIMDIKYSKEYGFLRKREHFNSYMSPDRGDLYLSTRTDRKDDLAKLKTIFPNEITAMKPLVKTDSLEEYNSIVEEPI